MVGAVQRFMMLKSKFNLACTMQIYVLGVYKGPNILLKKLFLFFTLQVKRSLKYMTSSIVFMNNRPHCV